MICNSAFFSWDPGGTPSPPCTVVSSFIKWGWCLLSSLAPSYLTNILWGLMKLCQQCFHFLERSYLWTFRVLYRYVSDLSFLCAVILACRFYLFYKAPANVMATSDGHQSSELPSHAPAWCRVTWSWNHKQWSPLWLVKMAQDTGLRGMHQDPGSDDHGCLSTNGRRPLACTPRGLRGVDHCLMWSVCPSSCLQGCMVQSCASWKLANGPDANLHVDSPLPLTFFWRQMDVPFQLWSWKG